MEWGLQQLFQAGAIDFVGSVMGASSHAARAATHVHAHVACRRALLDDIAFGFFVVFGETMHVDVPIRTILRAQPAADAVVFDLDLQRFTVAMDRVHWTTHHAIGVHARSAAGGNQEPIESHSIANQPRHTLMRIGAGLRAFVTACAAFQVYRQ